MSEESIQEIMLEAFIYETSQLLGQLEDAVLASEKDNCYCEDAIHEVFRAMHTLKGSSSMMMLDNISNLSHKMEDLFFYIREEKPQTVDCGMLSDIILSGIDFIKVELEKIKNHDAVDGDCQELLKQIADCLSFLKERQESVSYHALIYFDEDCGMEDIRAYTAVTSFEGMVAELHHVPEDIMTAPESAELIKENGFSMFFTSRQSKRELEEVLRKVPFQRKIVLERLTNPKEIEQKECEETKDTVKIKNES
ncbi:MAG: two-component system, chemotaxis family, sensor kinase CheA, partial [Clostridiales bacterium]|nr:two-component system, chemotaxis family, sensor kinase CheA [Clostridiales bacterium]